MPARQAGQTRILKGCAVPSRDPLDVLLAAAGARQTVQIDYESRSGGTRAWRPVDPYAVEPRGGLFWELHGGCHRRAAIPTFALDQVRAVRPLGDAFTRREAQWEAQWEAVTRTHAAFGLRGGPPLPVDVLFLPPVAAYARGRRWPDGLALATLLPGGRRAGAAGADGGGAASDGRALPGSRTAATACRPRFRLRGRLGGFGGMMSLPTYAASPPARTSSSGAPLGRFAPAPLLKTGALPVTGGTMPPAVPPSPMGTDRCTGPPGPGRIETTQCRGP